MANHSPIKTRQNVRQTLLQQEELERIEYLKENHDKIQNGGKSSDIEVVEVVTSSSDQQQQRRMKHRHRASNDNGEPLHIKKSRRETSTSDQDTSLHQSHSMNTSNNSTKMSPHSVNTTSMFNRTQTNNTMISGFGFSANVNNNNQNGSFSNNTSLNSSFNASSGAMMSGIDSNPIHWQTDEVIKYLLENKFDQHLNLIKEHVSY